MIPLHQHIYHHTKKVVHHVRKHHKKYLFVGTAMAGFFAITKVMVLFATSFALFSASHDTTFADSLPLDTIVQETPAVVPEETVTPDDQVVLSDTASTDTAKSQDISVDTGTLLDLIEQHTTAESGTNETIGIVDTGVVDSIDTNTGSVDTGSENTVSEDTGVTSTVSENTDTTDSNTNSGTFENTGVSYYDTLLANQITYCHTGDLLMATPLSGQTFAGITSFQWALSGGCLLDNLSFQLYDHNNQWIEISSLSGSNLGFSFDSTFLYTGGWYATTGLNASGEVYVIDPGLYSGVATLLGTGYQVKILNDAGEELYHSSGFTIDNRPTTLTGLTFLYTGNALHFLFSGTKLLNRVQLSLSTGMVFAQTTSGLEYDYILGGLGDTFSGSIGYSVSFSDISGNTGTVSGTGYVSFTGSTLTGTVLSPFAAMKEEILKFNQCKEDLVYKPISLDVGGKKFDLDMPDFQKDDVKKLVSAFSFFVVRKLDSVHTLKQADLDEITKTYNNFLVVLKLMRDDDNECQQTLGNYYMGVFKSTMETYGITEL